MTLKIIPLPKQSRLHELFDYDPETGNLIRKIVTSNRVKVGTVAGSINALGYRVTGVDGVTYQLHRLVYVWHHGDDIDLMDKVVDHKDNDRLNNRIENLRAATQAENMLNKMVQSNNQLGIRGVIRVGNRFKATIQHDKQHHRLGSFGDLDSAIAARNEAVERLHGQFGKLT